MGCAVIRALHGMNLPARALVRGAGNAERVRQAGAAEVIEADMENWEDLEKAFCGVNAVYHIAPAAHPREEEMGRRVLEVASKQPDMYFVYHSVLHSVLIDLPHHRQKLHLENAVVESGLSYTIVQPAVFMQMLAAALPAAAGGVFPQKFFTGPDTEMNLVDLDDVAAAVARMFATGEYQNGSYELCGPQNISEQELCRALSAVAGREVRTSYIADSSFLEMSRMDPDSYPAKTLLTMFHHYNRHSFRGNSDVLTWILGRKPTTLEKYLKQEWAAQNIQ